MGESSEHPTVKVPLDQWVRDIALESGREAAASVLAGHKTDCQISDVIHDLWGNGKPGLKADVAELKLTVAALAVKRTKLGERAWSVLSPVAAALIVAVIFWLMFVYKNTSAAAETAKSPSLPAQTTTRGVTP